MVFWTFFIYESLLLWFIKVQLYNKNAGWFTPLHNLLKSGAETPEEQEFVSKIMEKYSTKQKNLLINLHKMATNNVINGTSGNLNIDIPFVPNMIFLLQI